MIKSDEEREKEISERVAGMISVSAPDLVETVCLLDIQCEALRADNAALLSELRRRGGVSIPPHAAAE